MINVCILDYGFGNVASVYNIVSYLGYTATISNKKDAISSATHVILPGVGSFAAAMSKIRGQNSLATLENEILYKKKPFLGICVGMQVLVEIGYENGEHKGLGWVTGSVDKLEVNELPLPHIVNVINNGGLFD